MKNIAVSIIAIVGIVILGYKALSMGIDSGVMVGTIGIIGGIAGYKVKAFREQRKRGGNHGS